MILARNMGKQKQTIEFDVCVSWQCIKQHLQQPSPKGWSYITAVNWIFLLNCADTAILVHMIL